MVGIRIDYEADGWQQKALRCLEAGATLLALPDDKLDALRASAEERSLPFRVEQSDDGWSVIPSPGEEQTTDPDGVGEGGR